MSFIQQKAALGYTYPIIWGKYNPELLKYALCFWVETTKFFFHTFLPQMDNEEAHM